MHPYSGGRQVPNLADVGTTKFLGAVYGIDAAKVEAELTKTLRTQLERVDAANVGGAVKLLICNDYIGNGKPKVKPVWQR